MKSPAGAACLLALAALAVTALLCPAPVRAADRRTPPPTALNASPRATSAVRPTVPSTHDAAGSTPVPARQVLSPDTELASIITGAPGQASEVTITSGVGEQLAIGSYVPSGGAIKLVAAAPPIIAVHRVYWADAQGTISSLAAHTAVPLVVGTIPGVLPTTRVTIAVAPNAAEIMVRAVTIPESSLVAADERLFSIAVGSPAVLLNQEADKNWADSGVPEMIGWDSTGPVEITDANLLSARPDHGNAVHLDAVTGNVAGNVGGDSCVLVSQTEGGSSLCGSASSLIFNIVNSQGRAFWKAPAPDQWVDKSAELSPDGSSVATTDRVYDYLGDNRALPAGFDATGWVDSTHVLGVATATQDLAIVDIGSIQRINPIPVQGTPLGVVAPDDIVNADPPVKPTPTPAPVIVPPPPVAPPQDLTKVYLLALVLVCGAGGSVYYVKNREQVDALVATLQGKYKEHEAEVKRRREEDLQVSPKPEAPKQAIRPAQRLSVRGADFSALLDERALGLVKHDAQSFCNFVLRWLAQDPKGQGLVMEATPDLPDGTPREERLERGAQRLARSQSFAEVSRTLIVPWLSSSSR